MKKLMLARATDELLTNLKSGLAQNLQAEWKAPAVGEQAARYDLLEPRSSAVSDAAFRFFMLVAIDWFRCPISEMYKAAKLTAEQGQKYCDELEKFGLARIHVAKTFRPGGQLKFILPTAAGKEKLREAHAQFMEIQGDAPHGNGDGTHIWYQHRVARSLEKKGWKAEIEMILKDKRVDVGAVLENGKHLVAYEIVNEGLQKEVSNLRLDLADGWHRIVFCVGTKEIKAELDALIKAELGVGILGKVQYEYLPKFK